MFVSHMSSLVLRSQPIRLQYTYVCQQCCSNIIIKIEIWFHPSFFSRKVIILLSNHVNLLSHFLSYDFLNDAWEFFPISRSIRRSIFKKGIMISYLVLYLDRKKIVNPWDVLCVLRFAWFLRVIRASYTFLFCDDVGGIKEHHNMALFTISVIVQLLVFDE